MMAVGVVVEVNCGKAFVARKALRDGVRPVWRQFDEPPFLNGGDQPAARFADPTERLDLFVRGVVPHGCSLSRDASSLLGPPGRKRVFRDENRPG